MPKDKQPTCGSPLCPDYEECDVVRRDAMRAPCTTDPACPPRLRELAAIERAERAEKLMRDAEDAGPQQWRIRAQTQYWREVYLRHKEENKRLREGLEYFNRFVPKWAEELPPEGSCVTFYGTLSREGDLKVIERVKEIRQLLAPPPSPEGELPEAPKCTRCMDLGLVQDGKGGVVACPVCRDMDAKVHTDIGKTRRAKVAPRKNVGASPVLTGKKAGEDCPDCEGGLVHLTKSASDWCPTCKGTGKTPKKG